MNTATEARQATARPTVDDVIEEVVCNVARKRAEEMIPINGDAIAAKHGNRGYMVYESLAAAQDFMANGLRAGVRREAHAILHRALFQALTTTPNPGEGA
jgi:hypothetical protein